MARPRKQITQGANGYSSRIDQKLLDTKSTTQLLRRKNRETTKTETAEYANFDNLKFRIIQNWKFKSGIVQFAS